VRAATEKVAKAARAAGKPVCVMVGAVAESEIYRAMGASAFIVSSDQGFMRQAAGKVATDFAALRSIAGKAQ
jgi:2-keto-3-deoxy-L-rhamnonate aldolase RhmA